MSSMAFSDRLIADPRFVYPGKPAPPDPNKPLVLAMRNQLLVGAGVDIPVVAWLHAHGCAPRLLTTLLTGTAISPPRSG